MSSADGPASRSVFRTKSIEQSVAETEEPEHQLRRELSALSLTAWGIGVIVGTGIFVLTGVAAATRAGPAVSLSFVVRRSPARLPPSATPSSPRPCRSPARPTRSPTRRSAS